MASSWTVAQPKVKKPAASSEIPNYFGTVSDGGTAVSRLARIPGADPAIYEQFNDVSKLRETINSSTGTYFDALKESQAQADSNTSGDLNELEALFSPTGYQAGLQDIRTRRKDSLNTLDSVLFGDIRKALSMGRIGSGGMAGSGLSSYLARIAGGEAAKVRSNEAMDAANQERSDLAALMTARQGAVGKRTAVMDTALQRLLAPIDTAAKADGMYSDALQKAIQQAILNSIIGVGTKVSD